MSNKPGVSHLIRISAIAAVLALPMAPAALAQGAPKWLQQPCTTGQCDAAIMRAARAPATTAAPAPSAPMPWAQQPCTVGQCDAAIMRAARSGTAPSRSASNAPVVGQPDVLGHGGSQDELARQIYRPGSRPAGW